MPAPRFVTTLLTLVVASSVALGVMPSAAADEFDEFDLHAMVFIDYPFPGEEMRLGAFSWSYEPTRAAEVPVDFDFYVDDVLVSRETVVANSWGDAYVRSAPWLATEGEHTFRVVVDADDRHEEWDEIENNEDAYVYTVVAARPDIELTLGEPVLGRSHVAAPFTVCNVGDKNTDANPGDGWVDAGYVTLKLAGETAGSATAFNALPALEPGACTHETAHFPTMVVGDYVVSSMPWLWGDNVPENDQKQKTFSTGPLATGAGVAVRSPD